LGQLASSLLQGNDCPSPHAPDDGLMASVRFELSRKYMNAFASDSVSTDGAGCIGTTSAVGGAIVLAEETIGFLKR